ncbi:MAG: hypothetical protein Q8O19_05490 [Rectinemataceae bacterium]|nr:hypothetical protein [Rectinemataceae bacterium]
MTKRTIAARIALLALTLSGALTAHAQDGSTNPGGGTDGSTNPGCGSESGGLVNPLNKVCSLDDFLEAILGGIVEIGTIILIMMLVYVGFLFVAARGNAEKIQSAKSALVWTVIGGLILLGATAIQMVITETVGSLS